MSDEVEEEDTSLAIPNGDEVKNANNAEGSTTTKDKDNMEPLKLQVGGLYDGRVTRILQFGAFVELAPDKEGLVHISKLAEYRVEKVEDVVNVGDMIWVKIIEIDEKGRINLSHKDALREIEVKRQSGIDVSSTYQRYEESEQAVEIGPRVGGLYNGKVIRIFQFGAFVELAPGKEGLVHISKLAEYRVEKVEDVVNVGDMIWVKIIEIDEKGRINLSRKDAMREIEIKQRNGEIIK